MERQCGQYLIFSLAKQKFALPLHIVERVLRAAEITPLSKAPETVLGLINLKGTIIPVIGIHRRFRLPEKEVELSDQFIIAQSPKRSMALLVNEVIGIENTAEEDITDPQEIAPGVELVSGVIRQNDGLILVPDLNQMLSFSEIKQLEKAIKGNAGKKGRTG